MIIRQVKDIDKENKNYDMLVGFNLNKDDKLKYSKIFSDRMYQFVDNFGFVSSLFNFFG